MRGPKIIISQYWLVVSTPLKKYESNWKSSSPIFGVKIEKNIWDTTTVPLSSHNHQNTQRCVRPQNLDAPKIWMPLARGPPPLLTNQAWKELGIRHLKRLKMGFFSQPKLSIPHGAFRNRSFANKIWTEILPQQKSTTFFQEMIRVVQLTPVLAPKLFDRSNLHQQETSPKIRRLTVLLPHLGLFFHVLSTHTVENTLVKHPWKNLVT